MNIAPTDISAAARSAFTGGERSTGVRLTRALVAGLTFAALASVSALSVAAGFDQRDGHGEGRGDMRGEARIEHQRERIQPAPQQREMPAPRDMQPQGQPQREARPFDTRAYDMRLDEARRQQAQQQQDTGRRSGRMTPDERRELRRQINEAGMDLYPNTPRR